MLREEALHSIENAIVALDREGLAELAEAVDAALQLLRARTRLEDAEIVAVALSHGLVQPKTDVRTIIAFAREIMKKAAA